MADRQSNDGPDDVRTPVGLHKGVQGQGDGDGEPREGQLVVRLQNAPIQRGAPPYRLPLPVGRGWWGRKATPNRT